MTIKRNSYSINEKKAICEYYDKHPNSTLSEISNYVNIYFKKKVPLSTLSGIIKNKEVIHNIKNSNNKKIKNRININLENSLYNWFIKAQNSGITITDLILQEQAKRIGQKMEINNFKYSKGWIDNFKKSRGIKLYKKHGESANIKIEDVKQEIKTIKQKLSKYDPSDIYNMDETGLFYKLEPNKTLATSQIYGSKRKKERISVGLCTNLPGTDKLKPIIIHKYLNPRCFKNSKIKELVSYYSNNKAWMSACIFNDWLIKLNRSLCRNICLLVDNCPSHDKNICKKLSKIELTFLPKGTTAITQPLDRGIIFTFKMYYKRLLVSYYVSNFNESRNEEISVKKGIEFCVSAWNSVTETTIKNCFFNTPFFGIPPNKSLVDVEKEKSIEILQRLTPKLGIEDPIDMEEYINENNINYDEYEEIVYENEIDGTLEVTGNLKMKEIKASLASLNTAIEDLSNMGFFTSKQHVCANKLLDELTEKYSIKKESRIQQKSILDFIK